MRLKACHRTIFFVFEILFFPYSGKYRTSSSKNWLPHSPPLPAPRPPQHAVTPTVPPYLPWPCWWSVCWQTSQSLGSVFSAWLTMPYWLIKPVSIRRQPWPKQLWLFWWRTWQICTVHTRLSERLSVHAPAPRSQFPPAAEDSCRIIFQKFQLSHPPGWMPSKYL